jgi:glucose-6-phosphate isomerase
LSGQKVNNTEGRPVLHTALRKNEGEVVQVDGQDVVAGVVDVRKRMAQFSESVRSGQSLGYSGKKLVNIVAIGIGGSFLGPEFVYEALRFDATCREASKGMTIKFLANVDPIDFSRATDGLNVEETLFVIVSKTFTTAETMLNARTCRNHILNHYKVAEDQAGEVLGKHLCAVSTNLEATRQFGIKDENVFGFWNWVGGRYSVSSAVGLLPLNLIYGH